MTEYQLWQTCEVEGVMWCFTEDVSGSFGCLFMLVKIPSFLMSEGGSERPLLFHCVVLFCKKTSWASVTPGSGDFSLYLHCAILFREHYMVQSLRALTHYRTRVKDRWLMPILEQRKNYNKSWTNYSFVTFFYFMRFRGCFLVRHCVVILVAITSTNTNCPIYK